MADHFSTTRSVARKEFRGFFATPAAYLFLGAFLAVTLFVFFWIETFFARNIADVRPLFQWLPLLLIFWWRRWSCGPGRKSAGPAPWKACSPHRSVHCN